jgi:hypothetical protein
MKLTLPPEPPSHAPSASAPAHSSNILDLTICMDLGCPAVGKNNVIFMATRSN